MPPVVGPVSGGSGASQPRSLREAAEAFEAMFVGQLLRLAREAGQEAGEGGLSTMMEFAEEKLASEIARNGGFGLSKLVESQLR